jgi:hypothetical protein
MTGTVLPELLQQAQAQLAVAASSSSSSSLSHSRAGSSGSSSSSGGAGQGPKVGLTSPAKQGILGRVGRGEMINGSTSNATLNAPAPAPSKIVSQNVNGTRKFMKFT